MAAALAGRQMLVVDNCERVLEAAAEVVETILARTKTVKVMATSREGLRAAGEQVWPVPSLEVAAGVVSAAVESFVARARAVVPGFGLADPDDAAAVIDICQRLWRCSTPPSTTSTEPATPPPRPGCSPTWPCASTGSISQMSLPPSMAYGASTLQAGSQYVVELPGVVDHLRAVLGDTAFDNCAATGAAMDAADAVAYARHHIELARRQAANPDSGRTQSPPDAPFTAPGQRK